MKYVAMVIAGGVVGFLAARWLSPLVLERNVLFLAVPILLMAALLFARATRRGRSGS